MTTLELAEKIATAVLKHRWESRYHLSTEPPVPEQFGRVVLQTLDANHAWFCRLPTQPDGGVHSEDEQPFPYQPELFR